MICVNCNKKIANYSKFCPYCGKPVKEEVEQEIVIEETTSEKSKDTSAETIVVNETSVIDKNYEFKNALQSTIFGAVACTIGLIAYIVSMFLPILSAVLSVGIVIFTVFAIIKGVKAIKAFKYARKTANVKPVATLVLGIVGCALSALAFYFFVLAALSSIIIGFVDFYATSTVA